jgi:hypothetical protein
MSKKITYLTWNKPRLFPNDAQNLLEFSQGRTQEDQINAAEFITT